MGFLFRCRQADWKFNRSFVRISVTLIRDDDAVFGLAILNKADPKAALDRAQKLAEDLLSSRTR